MPSFIRFTLLLSMALLAIAAGRYLLAPAPVAVQAPLSVQPPITAQPLSKPSAATYFAESPAPQKRLAEAPVKPREISRGPGLAFQATRVKLDGMSEPLPALVAQAPAGERVVPFEEMHTNCDVLNERRVPFAMHLRIDPDGKVIEAAPSAQLEGYPSLPIGAGVYGCRFDPFRGEGGDAAAVTVTYRPERPSR